MEGAGGPAYSNEVTCGVKDAVVNRSRDSVVVGATLWLYGMEVKLPSITNVVCGLCIDVDSVSRSRIVCLRDFFRRMAQKMNVIRAARTTTPPAAPPTIAPINGLNDASWNIRQA